MKIRLTHTSLRAAAAALLVVLICCASPALAKQQRPLYWGAWIGSQITGDLPPWDMSAVSRFEKTVGKGLSMLEFATPFGDCSQSPCTFSPFPTKAMQAVRNFGTIPFLSWSSQSTPASIEQPDFQLADVIDGSYDSYLTSFAREAARWKHPFFLRFDWEMNGNWFAWGNGANGNRPGEYVAAWRHVHDIFTKVGATNATWVWCPYANAKDAYSQLHSYYPGNRYVDWTCLDGYNWGRAPANPQPWMSFERIFGRSYRAITRQIAPGKPMLLGEIASNGAGRSKAAWIRQMFRTLVGRYQRIRGLIWFNQFDRGITWPIETSPGAVRAFSSGLRNNPFLGRRFGNLSTSPIPPPR
jgi:hypothetical protein